MQPNGLTGIPNGLINVPSPGQMAEVEKVRGMQVRTEVAKMVCHLLADRQTSPRTWAKWARHIEGYILTGELDGEPSTPVQPGG